MKVFSKILLENVNSNSFTITTDEFNEYKKVIEETKRSKQFLKLLWIISQNPVLFDKEIFNDAMKGKNTAKLSQDIIKDIVKLCKNIGDEVRILPQFLSAAQRDAVINKKINPNDLMIDLESQKGRDAIVKKYIPLIEKLVKQYVDKCPLSKEDLRSAAMVGLIQAMDTYKNPEELEEIGKSGSMNFTSFAAYCIRNQIIKDITEFGRDVKISRYYQNKLKDNEESAIEFSIDNIKKDSDDDNAMSIDRFFSLSDSDSGISDYEKEDVYKKLFKYLESKFSSRDCIILYKTWGVNGYKREKVKDVAKELGISSPAVVQACNRIIKFIANDKYCKNLYSDLLESLIDDYVAIKLFEVYNEDKKTIAESFIFDDLYILLEDIKKWNNKDKFQDTINNATNSLSVDDALYIYHILQNKIQINDKTIKKNKGAFTMFLENVYPNKSFKNASISEIIDYMTELKTNALRFAIVW